MKKTRLYINGIRKRDIYVGWTKWAVFKYKVQIWFRRLVVACMILGMGYGLIQIGMYISPDIIYKAEAQTVFVDNLSKKIEQMKNEVVDGIGSCESLGYDEEDGLIVYDPLQSNPKGTAAKNVPSIGQFQWKQTTIIGYYKSLYGKDITMKDAALIALDYQQARSLAYDVIFKVNGGWKNWKNCGIKLKVEQQLKTIAELEK